MSAWIRLASDLRLLAVSDRLWLIREPVDAQGSPSVVKLDLPAPKAAPVRRNIGNENKKANEDNNNKDEVTTNETQETSQQNSNGKNGTTPQQQQQQDENDDDGGDKVTKDTKVSITAVHLPACQTCVLACTSDKRLIVWMRHRPEAGADQSGGEEEWKLQSVRETPRKCIQVRVTGTLPPMVIVADRAGDVYEYPLDPAAGGGTADGATTAPEPRLLLGRLSMLLDLTLSGRDDLLAVCDRDEKIQISRYPDCFDIVSFCLGHRQFVTSIQMLPTHDNRLVSVGGDGQLKLWAVDSGRCVASADCWAEAQTVDQLLPFEQFHSRKEDQDIRPPLKKVLCSGEFVAVLYCRVPYIHVFRCVHGDSLLSCGGVATEANVWDADFDQDGRLWVLTPGVSVYKLDANGAHHLDRLSPALKEAFDNALKPVEGVTEADPDLDVLYKQWFDNLEEYHSRKRQREEVKKQKNLQNKKQKTATESAEQQQNPARKEAAETATN